GRTPVATTPDPTARGRGRFVVDLVEALGLDRPWIVGHSMGGVVASAAVDMAPEAFRGIGFVASQGLEPNAMMRKTPFGLLDRLLRFPILGRAMAPINRRAFASTGFRGYSDAELYRTIHVVAHTDIDAHADRIIGLNLPTLVAWSDDDPLIAAAISRELAEACPDGPRLHFTTGGHNLQKTRAAEIAAALLAECHR
ncbi:MAG: alpha/beta fold hydrolase, partial [Acidobacteriota bacterium]